MYIYIQDLHDLFATLIVSLRLQTHRTLFKAYHHTFTTDDAAQNLSALKFAQSSRAPDPNEPSRVIITTTTTFMMNRDRAKDICQHFVNAHLIQCGSDSNIRTFRDKGTWAVTPKGYNLLERFIHVYGISADHLHKALQAHRPITSVLLVERRATDDEIDLRLSLFDKLFRHFAGTKGNYPCPKAQYGTAVYSPEYGYYASDHAPATYPPDETFDRSKGMEVADVIERMKGGEARVVKHAFNAFAATEWLLDYTTVCGRDEASEVLAHFERLDLIKLCADKPRTPRSRIDAKPDADIVSVRGPDVGGMITEGEFRCHYKVVYAFTERGREVAQWEGYRRPQLARHVLQRHGGPQSPSQATARLSDDLSANRSGLRSR